MASNSPFKARSGHERPKLGRIFGEVAVEGVAILPLEHNMRFVTQICSHLYVVASGKAHPQPCLQSR